MKWYLISEIFSGERKKGPRGIEWNAYSPSVFFLHGWEPREGPGLDTPIGKGGKKNSHLAPFHTTKLAPYTHLSLNSRRLSIFQSHLILTFS